MEHHHSGTRTRRTMRRRALLIVSSALTALVVVAAAAGSDKDSASLTVIVGSLSPQLAVHGPQYIPQGAGWWSASGLNVKTQNVNGSLVSVSTLQAGQGDLMEATGETIAPAVAQGANLVSVYQETYSPTYSWVFPSGSTLTAGADLKGATIGISTLGAGSYTLAQAVLATYGLNWQKDVNIVATGTGSGGYVALQNHRVDALLWITSQLSQFDAAGVKFKYQRLSAYRAKYPGAVDAVLSSSLSDPSKRAAIVKYLQGVTRALKLCESSLPSANNPDTQRCWQDYKTATGDTTSLADSASALAYSNDDYRLPRQAYGRYGYSQTSYWQTIEKSQIGGNVITTAPPPASLFTNALLKEANQNTCAKVNSLRIATDATKPTAAHAELWAGMDQGFYSDEGVAPQVAGTASAAAAVARVTSGKADVALVAAPGIPSNLKRSVVVVYESTEAPHRTPADVFVTTKKNVASKKEALTDFFRGFTNARHFCEDNSNGCATSFLKAAKVTGARKTTAQAIAGRLVDAKSKALTGAFTSLKFGGLSYDNSLLASANYGACAQY